MKNQGNKGGRFPDFFFPISRHFEFEKIYCLVIYTFLSFNFLGAMIVHKNTK